MQLAGQDVHLTQSEYKIVSPLTQYAGKVLTYDFIIPGDLGEKATGDTQNLRANMAKIRRKLEKNPGKPEYIFTEVGVGYRMAEGIVHPVAKMQLDQDSMKGKRLNWAGPWI